MKKTSWIISSILVLLMPLILINSCKTDYTKKEYLLKVLTNLEQIKSATYYYLIENYAPGDTSPAFTMQRYYKEYSNKADSTIGSSYVVLLQEDTTKMTFCYDGKMRATVYEEDKIMVIDSFQNNSLPHRPVPAPFINYCASIIKYAIETKDSISTNIEDLGVSIHFSLAIFGSKQVEFFGKPYYNKNPYGTGEEVSRYDIWIDKSNDLPFRLKREMSHQMFVVTSRDAEFNMSKIEDFIAADYFPPDFAFKAYGSKNEIMKNDLLGKIAPSWILIDKNNNTNDISNFKSKVFMIQFTSVSCGPCRASVPFLNQLLTEYKYKDFDFVSIESWTRNTNVLKGYQERNGINYKFLMSTEDITKSYQVHSVPVFYILDKNRVIRKVIRGYGVGTTDKEITDAINELI